VNHIKTHSGQYTTTQRPIRQVQDMVNEMAQELIDLPPKIAYAKLIQEKGEERVVIKYKFKTRQPPKVITNELAFRLTRSFIENKTLDAGMVKERVHIEKEIRERQENWRRQIPPSKEPPPTFYS
jgi:hypothetical protein